MKGWLVLFAMIGLGMFFLNSEYGTVRPCRAYERAFVADFPNILREAGRMNDSVAMVNLGRLFLDANDEATNAMSAEMASKMTSDMGTLGCLGSIAIREWDYPKYVAKMAQALVQGIENPSQ